MKIAPAYIQKSWTAYDNVHGSVGSIHWNSEYPDDYYWELTSTFRDGHVSSLREAKDALRQAYKAFHNG